MGRTITTIAVAAGAAVSLTVLVAWLVCQESSRQAEAASRAAQARERLAAVDDLAAGLSEAEARRCAYLTRADPAQRESCEAAVGAVRRGLQRLRSLAGVECGVAALDHVAELTGRKLALLDRSLRARDAGRFNDRVQLALTRDIQSGAEDLRRALADLRAVEDQALQKGTHETHSSARYTELIVVVGVLLSLLCLGLSAAGVSRELIARDRSRTNAREAERRAKEWADEETGRLLEARAALAELTTLRERLQEQLAQAQRLASVGRLTSGVAHDFNNLLQLILACSETSLLTLPEDDPSRPYVAKVVQAGQRAAELTRRLLGVGRGGTSGPVNLNDLLADLELLVRSLAGKNVEVVLVPTPGLAPVWADRGQLDQALLNLVVNARDAMPDGGKLILETRPATIEEGADHAVLVVTDTGCGMDAETKARLFEPFFTTKEAGKGTGLGMTIIQDAINKCLGRLELDSEPGRGTSVRVYLPFVSK